MSKPSSIAIVLVLSLLVLASDALLAAAPQPAEAPAQERQADDVQVRNFPVQAVAAGEVLRMVLALGLVLGAIALVAWLLRRVNGLQRGVNSNLQILEGISLGTRERAVLVQVGEQQLLLGICPGQIQTLHVLETPVPVSRHPSKSPFVQHLHKALEKGEA